jgi:hypothetical protein
VYKNHINYWESIVSANSLKRIVSTNSLNLRLEDTYFAPSRGNETVPGW